MHAGIRPDARGDLASGARPGRSGTRRGRRIPGGGHARCWPAGSATTCSPTTTGAAAATARWPAPRCTGRWARPSAKPCCGARAATPTSTSSTPARASTTTPSPDVHLDPIPLLVRDGVLSMAVLASPPAVTVMDQRPYDVLARIRANRAPQPAGERCEMCAEQIADEHQHVVNVEGRQLMCVCRGCYLLFTDSHAAAALPGGAGPLPALPRLRAGPPRVGGAADSRSGWRSSSATRRWTGPSRSIPARPAPPSPNWTSTPGTRSPPPTPG